MGHKCTVSVVSSTFKQANTDKLEEVRRLTTIVSYIQCIILTSLHYTTLEHSQSVLHTYVFCLNNELRNLLNNGRGIILTYNGS